MILTTREIITMSLVTPEVEMNEEVEVETTTKVEAVEEKTEDSTVGQETTAVAEVKPNNTELRQATTAQFLAAQTEAGFEGLDIGGFSFERVRLQEGKFLIGSDDEELGTTFNFIALSTRNIFVVRQDDSQDAKTYYSYCPNGSIMSDGSSAEGTLNEWKEDGYGVEGNPLDIKKYLEVMAEVTDRDDHHSGAMVSLSIPPSSLQRFGGIAFQAARKYHSTLDQVVVTATVGARVGEGSRAFRPWNFKVDRAL